jgi:hypothetical protein
LNHLQRLFDGILCLLEIDDFYKRHIGIGEKEEGEKEKIKILTL